MFRSDTKLIWQDGYEAEEDLTNMNDMKQTHSYSIFIAYEYGTKEKEWFKFGKLIKNAEGVVGPVEMTDRYIRFTDNDGLRKNHIDNISKDIKHNPFLKRKNKLSIKDGNLLNRFRGRILDQIFVSGKKKQATQEVLQLIDLLLHNSVMIWNDEIPEDLRVVYTGGDD